MLPRRTPQSNGVVRTACNIILLVALNFYMILPRRTPQNNGVVRMACTTIYHQWYFEATSLFAFVSGRTMLPRRTPQDDGVERTACIILSSLKRCKILEVKEMIFHQWVDLQVSL